jgi:hypothetical protein
MSGPALRVIEGGSTRSSGGVRTDPSAAAASGPASLAARTGRLRRHGGPVYAETSAGTGRGLLSAALSTASAWLVEPAEATEAVAGTAARAPTAARAVIAVFGLARAAGATVVARALAAELAGRDSSGTAAVACEARAAGIPLATQAATRLARVLEDVPRATTRAVGRLCLIEGADHSALADTARHLAPLVLDAGSASVGGVPASIADRTVLVTTPAVEPALARVAAGCLARVGAEATVVLNRARAAGSYHDDEEAARGAQGSEFAPGGRRLSEPTDVLRLPESRLGAQLALGGREARGDLGRAIAALADRCEGVA